VTKGTFVQAKVEQPRIFAHPVLFAMLLVSHCQISFVPVGFFVKQERKQLIQTILNSEDLACAQQVHFVSVALRIISQLIGFLFLKMLKRRHSVV
jgi:hypothetical protein